MADASGGRARARAQMLEGHGSGAREWGAGEGRGSEADADGGVCEHASALAIGRRSHPFGSRPWLPPIRFLKSLGGRKEKIRS